MKNIFTLILLLFFTSSLFAQGHRPIHIGPIKVIIRGQGTSKQPGVLSINRQNPLEQNTSLKSVVYRVTFSEKVSGVNYPDFTVVTASGNATGTIATNAVVAANGSGAVYDVTVANITGSGNVRLDLKASGTGIVNAKGAPISGGFTTGQLYTIVVATTPVLTAVSIKSSNSTTGVAKAGDVVTLSFTASESINTPVVTIAGKAANATIVAGNSFTANYTMTSLDAEGVVPFSIAFTSTAGVAGVTVSKTTNGTTVKFDRTAPAVISINRLSPLTTTSTEATVVYRVSFNEPVNGVDAADFTMFTTAGNAGGLLQPNSVVKSPNDASVYDVTLTSVSGSGSFRLDLNTSLTGITDIAGNTISAGFTAGQTFTNVPGFKSLTAITPVDLTQPTKDKPQSKVWFYANTWWSVLSATGGTKVFRLDGTTWTSVLTLTTKTSKPDCRVDGDLVHILSYSGALNNSSLYSIRYNAVTNTYDLWSERPAASNIVFPAGSETVSLLLDGNKRMWAASDGVSDMTVRWSDAPYTTWSEPITLGIGAKDDDICSLVAIPALNKIGLFWSNQNTKQFGFRTHADGTDPSVWTNDELPASQSALNIGVGFADDHLNLTVASDGTVYCAAKTSYNTNGYTKLMLLVRRPNGIWDSAYTVTTNPEGTQPIVLLNETKRKIKFVYASAENGGSMLYRECSMDNIRFSDAITLISNSGDLYDYATSTHERYQSSVVILATKVSSAPQQAVGVIASDDDLPPVSSLVTRAASIIVPVKEVVQETNLQVYPNPLTSAGTVNFTVPYRSKYELTLINSNGSRDRIIAKGNAEANVLNRVSINTANTASGIYLLKLRTDKELKVVKLFIN